jgi:hypothetical protein
MDWLDPVDPTVYVKFFAEPMVAIAIAFTFGVSTVGKKPKDPPRILFPSDF